MGSVTVYTPVGGARMNNSNDVGTTGSGGMTTTGVTIWWTDAGITGIGWGPIDSAGDIGGQLQTNVVRFGTYWLETNYPQGIGTCWSEN